MNPYETFKNYDRYKFMLEHLKLHLADTNSLLDIGCGRGELICALKELYPSIQHTGIDTDHGLLAEARAKESLDGVDFSLNNALYFDLGKKFDMVIMSGVLSFFDDYAPPIDNMITHIKPGGVGVIFGRFNPFDIDTLVQHRIKGKGEWRGGLNNFSISNFTHFMEKKVKDSKVKKFNLSTDLDNAHDPIRSYTMNTKEKGRIIANGAGVISNFYLITFKV